MPTPLQVILGKAAYPDDSGIHAQLSDQAGRVRARLSSVRSKVLVLSGKGGVGKSAVTSRLALALAWCGRRVGILDADLNGPSIPRMLGLGGARLAYGPGGAAAPEGPHGIRVASMAFVADPRGPVRWKGPLDLSPVWLGMMESGVLRELLADVAWGELDLLLVDLPPGAAADKPPALAGLVPDLDGALVVSTASKVALEVVRRSMLYARDLGIPMLGLVENMAEGAEAPGPLRALAEEFALPVLSRIPRDADLAVSLDEGVPLEPMHPVSRLFHGLGERLEGLLSRASREARP